MTNLTTRHAAAADADLLSRLNRDVQALHAAALPSRFKPPDVETFPVPDVLDLLAKPETVMLIGQVDDIPAGYLYAEIIRRAENGFRYELAMVYVHHISVLAGYRGRGVGKALIKAVRAVAQEQGIAQLGLEVWTFNEQARSFFRSQGFALARETLYLDAIPSLKS